MTPRERAQRIAEKQGWPNRTGALLDAIAGEIAAHAEDAEKRADESNDLADRAITHAAAALAARDEARAALINLTGTGPLAAIAALRKPDEEWNAADPTWFERRRDRDAWNDAVDAALAVLRGGGA